MIFRHLLNMRSHPTWVRGLKQNERTYPAIPFPSHPTWVRGLKPHSRNHTGLGTCRTLRGCVD